MAKRRAKVAEKYNIKQRAMERRQRSQAGWEIAEDYKRARQAIKDDWNLGPLAPNHFTGHLAAAYGAISASRYQMQGTLREEQRRARCEWMGGPKYINVDVGDRVVLLEGPDKGRIGNIEEVVEDTMTVKVSGLNKSNIRLPDTLRTRSGPAGVNLEVPIPLSGIRLVHPIVDPKTGQTRDVIINQLRATNVTWDRYTGKPEWDRLVPGLNIIIPWPQKEEEVQPEHKCDTVRLEVEDRTFMPTLLRPPVPETVIDELRGKYSRFRTRHEPEYIAKKEAEEQAIKDRGKLMDSMRTPLQEFHRAERERKKKKGKPRLTIEMLEEIGKVIARNRERMMTGACVTDVPSSSITKTTTAPSLPPPNKAPPSPPSSS